MKVSTDNRRAWWRFTTSLGIHFFANGARSLARNIVGKNNPKPRTVFSIKKNQNIMECVCLKSFFVASFLQNPGWLETLSQAKQYCYCFKLTQLFHFCEVKPEHCMVYKNRFTVSIWMPHGAFEVHLICHEFVNLLLVKINLEKKHLNNDSIWSLLIVVGNAAVNWFKPVFGLNTWQRWLIRIKHG